MAATPGPLVRCSVTVEVGGRAIPSASKELGVQLVSVGKGPPLLRVLGFKRDIRVPARDVQRVVDSKVADGRLALQCRDGRQTLQVVLSKAQPAQLEQVLRSLRGGDGGPSGAAGARAGSGGPPQKRPRMVATPAQGAPAGRAGGPDAGAAAGLEGQLPLPGPGACGAAAVSLCDFSEEVLRLVVSFGEAGHLRRLWEACSLLDGFARERQPAFRLMPSRGAAVPPDLVIQRVARHTMIRELDLCGYQDLPASATKALADALGASGGLKKLCLRGCKALTDAAVRRLLLSCPRLEMLDLLEVPRLSDRALEAPLGELRMLLVGTLGRRQLAAESAVAASRRRLEGTVVALDGRAPGPQQPQQQAVLGTSDFTSALLARLARPPIDPASAGGQQQEGAGAAAVGGCPLEHAVFAHCAEVMVLPRLPATLRHLDLRGASLQIPEAAAAGWRPLASCRQLAVLNLAHSRLLSGPAIAACVGSLPPSTLRALDLSETSADGGFLAALPARQPLLSHLRASRCRGLSDGVLAAWLGGLAALEVLDVSHCEALDEPFALVAAPPDRAAAPAPAPKLRLLGVGQTRLAAHIEEARRSLGRVAPDAVVRPTAVDLFDGYRVLPPCLV